MNAESESSNLEKSQIEDKSKTQIDDIKPKKRGRKKKVPDSDDDNDDDVVIIQKSEYANSSINKDSAPKKRGRKKKVKDDLDYVPTNYDSDKANAKSSNKQTDTNDANTNEDFDVEIKNGINDLTNLPIELLRMELVQRGYHEGVINRLDKWYLVSMLRETAFNHFNYFSFCSSRFGLNSWERNDGPMEKIFENDPETERKRLEEQRLKKEKEKEDEKNTFEDICINPDEFSKEKAKKPSLKRKRIFDFFE